MKTCTKCGETKCFSLFGKRAVKVDGLRSQCKQCDYRYAMAYSTNNREKVNTYARTLQKRLRKEKGKLTREEWCEKVASTAIGRKASSYKYAAKRRTQTNFYNDFDDFVFEEAVLLCDLRKKATGFAWHVDHIVPINHKQACGLHTASNFQVVPASWNFKKGNRNMDEFWNKI